MPESRKENAITPPIEDKNETSEPNKEAPTMHKEEEDNNNDAQLMAAEQHNNLPIGVLEGETAGVLEEAEEPTSEATATSKIEDNESQNNEVTGVQDEQANDNGTTLDQPTTLEVKGKQDNSPIK
eukprot:5558186-Ditylum_brightwellii.AAC.1